MPKYCKVQYTKRVSVLPRAVPVVIRYSHFVDEFPWPTNRQTTG